MSTREERLAEINRISSPEGCTAVDARKVKEYNRALAIEIDQLKASIASIHYHATKRNLGIIDCKATLLSIADECEHAVEELKEVK